MLSQCCTTQHVCLPCVIASELHAVVCVRVCMQCSNSGITVVLTLDVSSVQLNDLIALSFAYGTRVLDASLSM
jgi:hypothetical protein